MSVQLDTLEVKPYFRITHGKKHKALCSSLFVNKQDKKQLINTNL